MPPDASLPRCGQTEERNGAALTLNSADFCGVRWCGILGSDVTDVGLSMSAQSISQRSFSALGWVGIGAAGKIVSQLAVQIALARLLGPDAFGQFALVITVIGLGFMLSDLGLGAALVQKRDLSEEDVSFVLGWTTLAAGVFATLLFLGAPWITALLGAPQLVPMFGLAAVIVVMMAWRNISSSLLRRDLQFRAPQMVDLCGYLFVFGGVSLVLAMLGWGAWSMLIGFACHVLFSLVATYFLCRHTLRPRLRGDLGVLRFGAAALGNDLLAWVSNSLDRMVVGRFWGTQALGFYAVAGNLVRAPTTLALDAVQGLVFAGASRLQHDIPALRRGFLVASSAIALTAMPLMVLVALEAESIVVWIYGDSWRAAASLMAALALAIPFLGLAGLCASLLRATGGVGSELRIQATGAALLIGGLMLLSDLKIEHAVWWITLTTAWRALALVWVTLRRLGVTVAELLATWKGALALVLAASISWLACRLVLGGGLSGHSPWPLLAGAGGCALAMLAAARWILGMDLCEFLGRQLANRPFLAGWSKWLLT